MTPEELAKSLGLDGYCDFDVPDHCRTHCSPRDAPDSYCNEVMWLLDLARRGIGIVIRDLWRVHAAAIPNDDGIDVVGARTLKRVLDRYSFTGMAGKLAQ